MPCKPIKICLGPTSVPSHQAGTSDQNIGTNTAVSLSALHMGSGRESVKIQIPIEDPINNFLPNFKICKLILYLCIYFRCLYSCCNPFP